MTRRSVLAVAWTLALLAACLLPRRWVPEEGSKVEELRIPHIDKLVHATLFGGFALFWLRSGRRPSVVVAAGLLLAVATELGQGWSVIGRDPDVWDGVADGVGVLAATGAYLLTVARQSATAEAQPL